LSHMQFFLRTSKVFKNCVFGPEQSINLCPYFIRPGPDFKNIWPFSGAVLAVLVLANTLTAPSHHD